MKTEDWSAGAPNTPDELGASFAFRDSDYFRLLVENSQDTIVEVDDDGAVLYVSPNIRDLLGFTAEELLGRSVFNRVHAEDLAHVRAQFTIRAGRATGRHQHRDGTWRWLETSGRHFLTARGAQHRVLIARDVTAQKEAEAIHARLEAELTRTEKLTTLGTLAGGIAHDFNNILTAITAYATLARTDVADGGVAASLDEILKAVARARDLAQQVLTFHGPPRRERRPVDLRPVIAETLTLLRPTLPRTLEVITRFDRDCGEVLGEPSQLHQIVVNLCTNAIHATRGRDGRLEIALTRVIGGDPTRGNATAHSAGEFVCLSVTDNGHGMDSATQRRIFEPFFTTKPRGQGTGLGLAVVQRIVRDHGGEIFVESRPESGATFRTFLPARLRAAIAHTDVGPLTAP